MSFVVPSKLEHKLILFCFAKELAKQFPDITVCSGCFYNDFSQSHHIGCNTAALRATLDNAMSNVEKVDVLLNLLKLHRALGTPLPADYEINRIITRCNNGWKQLVADAVLFAYRGYDFLWSVHI